MIIHGLAPSRAGIYKSALIRGTRGTAAAPAAGVIASDRRTSVNRGTLEPFQLYIVLWQTWHLA